MSPPLFFFKVVLATQDLLKFHVNFRMDFSVSSKTLICLLMGIALNLLAAVSNIDILILNLPVH